MMKPQQEILAGLRSEAAGVAVIASTYVYFLIFAQFGFVHLAQSSGISSNALRTIMASMAISGFGSAIATGRWYTDSRAQRMLRVGFFASALAAIVSLAAHSVEFFCFLAALIGCSLGMLTVTLAAALPLFLPRRRLGLGVGIGTGLAYAVCNIPGVFAGGDRFQAGVAIGLCGIGCFFTFVHRFEFVASPIGPAEPRPPALRGASGAAMFHFAPLVVLFLVLVWLDSAAFFILQATPALNQFGWEGASLQWSNALMHFAAAIAAGLWLDRAGLQKVLTFAFVGLAAAILCMSSRTGAVGLCHWLYTAGVSFYSTALAFAPSMNRGDEQRGTPARRAGILYAVAGWLGSALGIGMAQDLHAVPSWFLWLAGAVFACHLGWLTAASPREFVHKPIWILGLTGLAMGVKENAREQTMDGSRSRSNASLGREVYLSEGCIHCHSQYVRPGTADEIWWGPAQNAAIVMREEPPLIGNRRQGPDLMNIGNRRSPEWNREHLINPRAFTPNSRMPSYQYLFAHGDSRGQALVSYLASLGVDTFAARSRTREKWTPLVKITIASSDEGANIFQENCAPCHGHRGKGDGLLAGRLGQRTPRDLTEAHWLFIPQRIGAAEHLLDLARVIKFGIPGTSMPGHETLTDPEIIALSAYIESLRIPPRIL